MIDIDIQKINFLKQLNIKHWKEIFMDKVTDLLSINNNDLEKIITILAYIHIDLTIIIGLVAVNTITTVIRFFEDH